MFANDRKTIGVFAQGMESHFQIHLCQGIMDEAKRLGYNIAVFSASGSPSEDFATGARGILGLPDYRKLDGVIMALDTMVDENMKTDLLENIKDCQCPIVSIRERRDECYNVLIDDDKCMEEMVRHFVEHHGFKDICFVAGPRGYNDSEQRLNCFLRIMNEAGMEVPPENIFHGHFWKDDGKPACKALINQRGKVPEAIICANDYMAISVCNELIERGLSIPEDVAICGFDGIWETEVCASSISTVQMPFLEMGKKAVEMINQVHNGEEVMKECYFDTQAIFRESCGCVRPDRESLFKARKEFYHRYAQQRSRRLFGTFMSIALEELESLEELASVLSYYMELLPNMELLHVCLNESAIYYQENLDALYTSEMYRIGTINGDGEVDKKILIFPKDELLPGDVTSNEPQMYIFFPLHYKKREFGYTAISFSQGGACDEVYQTWMVNVGNAIQDLLVRKELRELYENLGNSYVRDALTGLYNRRGFKQYGEELFTRAQKEKRQFFVVAADLDKLKYTNDTYGHAEGDRLLVLMARALRETAGEDTICARMGGDEYSVAGICDSKEEADDFLRRLEENRKRYKIEVSYGMAVSDLNEGYEMEHYMSLSDYYMYQDKEKKRGKTLC